MLLIFIEIIYYKKCEVGVFKLTFLLLVNVFFI
jgi:hypothetical protein